MSSSSYDSYVNFIMNIPRFSDKVPSMEKRTSFTRTVIEYINMQCSKSETVHSEGKASPQIIHVAGTNGKGSVCAYLNSILVGTGMKVGLFTSPHLVDIRERIQINNELISEDDFAACYETLDFLMKKQGISYMTFFEYLFYIGLIHFYVNQVDYIILETGLGGRLDATNTIERKSLTVITEIGFDHVQYLGDTIGQIAAEKAGIVRKGCPLVFVDKRKEATTAILETAELAGIKNEDIFMLKASDITEVSAKEDALSFKINNSLLQNSCDLFRINTGALYQCENAYLAIIGILVLKDKMVTMEHIRQGLINMSWPCRMEKVRSRLYIDGAHNEDGIRALISTVSGFSCKKTLMFAVVSDKDYTSMINHIVKSRLFDNIVVTAVLGTRQVDVNSIAGIFINACLKEGTSYSPVIMSFPDIREALNASLSVREDGYLFISGSLYLAGSVKKMIMEEADIL